MQCSDAQTILLTNCNQQTAWPSSFPAVSLGNTDNYLARQISDYKWRFKIYIILKLWSKRVESDTIRHNTSWKVPEVFFPRQLLSRNSYTQTATHVLNARRTQNFSWRLHVKNNFVEACLPQTKKNHLSSSRALNSLCGHCPFNIIS